MNAKKLLATAMGTGMMFASAMPALAADCVNGPTGWHSRNTCSIENKKKASVTTVNWADVYNKAEVKIKTGNESEYNTLGGDNYSGNGDATVRQKNIVNTTATSIGQTGGGGQSTGLNTYTGAGSKNKVEISNSKTAYVTTINNAEVTNKAYVKINTGNESEGNTVGGNNISGDGTAHVSQHSTVNTTETTIHQ